MPVSELAQTFSSQRVCLFGITKVRNRIALKAVRSTLHDDELGRSVIDMGLHQMPGCIELIVGRHPVPLEY